MPPYPAFLILIEPSLFFRPDILEHFEIDYVFRFTGYREYGIYEHVYTVAITNDLEDVLDLTYRELF